MEQSEGLIPSSVVIPLAPRVNVSTSVSTAPLSCSESPMGCSDDLAGSSTTNSSSRPSNHTNIFGSRILSHDRSSEVQIADASDHKRDVFPAQLSEPVASTSYEGHPSSSTAAISSSQKNSSRAHSNNITSSVNGSVNDSSSSAATARLHSGNSSADTAQLHAYRRAHGGPNTSLNYETDGGPLTIVRGEGSYLYDATGERYLDCVNNVTHVGHCHPGVTAAVCMQLQALNTNSRYLHPSQVQYTRELLATLPPHLQVMYMVCSGSEANDLALRIAENTNPGARHVAVMGGAYHGHTKALIQLSPYKFWGVGGEGKPSTTHVLPLPDPYRGENLDGRKAARAAIDAAHRAGGRVCAFYAESVLSCGGQVFFPDGYLQAVYEEMHAEGAICIADEVQCGFGRVGETFWGFQLYGVAPDIVVLGKSIGNGYPLAAVVTTRALADAWHSGMEYFNTYGGSTAAVAAGLAVLRAVQQEGLQQHALQVGEHLLHRLQQLQPQFPFLGDVRGRGLFLGIEVVSDPHTKRHAPRTARWIKERMRARRVLLSTDGPYDNVIKMKPPMVFGIREADILVDTLRTMLSEEMTPSVWASLQAEEAAFAASTLDARMQLYRANERELYTPARL